MSRVLAEFFGNVFSSDIHPYGFGEVGDFLSSPLIEPWRPPAPADWIIMNPPFNKATEFVREAIPMARIGVAMLLRTVWALDSDERAKLFEEHPLTLLCPFMGRLPILRGRVVRKAKSATAYSWCIWRKGANGPEAIERIPFDAQRRLERNEDYRQ